MDAGDLDRRLGIVTCSHCGAIYDLTRRAGRDAVLPDATQALSKDEAPERAPAALPPKFSVDRKGTERLRVTWRWVDAKGLFLLFFAIAWDAFLVNWYAIGLSSDDAPLIMLLFPIVHVAVGVGITYSALANLLNRTVLTVTRGTLRVKHSPLPWYPAPTIPTRDLEQLYVERAVSHTKNGTTVRWILRAVTREHTGLKVLPALDELSQALWLEQEIEDVLGIRDRPVAGEYEPGEGARR
jgi:hypothetical protein